MLLGDLLAGFEAREPQTVGNMTMIPLVNQGIDGVGNLENVRLERDADYDRLVIGSDQENDVTIVPQGLVFITKESAQDRTLPSAHLIGKGRAKDCPAFCVQSSQGGLMSQGNDDDREFRLLPMSIRKIALARRGEKGYSALWDDLGKFNSALGLSGDYLVTFFQKYEEQLAQFVAEFEPVDDQRGAIILINDEVAGVEVMPNQSAFLSSWDQLIRDCYGSEAIFQADVSRAKQEDILEDVADLDDLSDALDRLIEKEKVWTEQLVDSVLTQEVTEDEEQDEGDCRLANLSLGEYVGQVASNGDGTVYMTLFRKDANKRSFRWNK